MHVDVSEEQCWAWRVTSAVNRRVMLFQPSPIIPSPSVADASRMCCIYTQYWYDEFRKNPVWPGDLSLSLLEYCRSGHDIYTQTPYSVYWPDLTSNVTATYDPLTENGPVIIHAAYLKGQTFVVQQFRFLGLVLHETSLVQDIPALCVECQWSEERMQTDVKKGTNIIYCIFFIFVSLATCWRV